MKKRIAQLCKTLHLAHVVDAYETMDCEKPEQFLRDVLEYEVAQREEAKWARLMKKAAFPQVKTLEEYEFNAVLFPEPHTQEILTNLEFLKRRENVLMIGKVGTGKTHLAIALGIKACRQGKGVRFFRVQDLVSLLQKKHDTGTLPKFHQELLACDLLILDEMGFVPFHQTGAQLLFHLVSGFYENKSVIVTSNLEFGQWGSVFGDNRLAAALVDRLVHHAHILAFTGESYRLTHALSGIKP